MNAETLPNDIVTWVSGVLPELAAAYDFVPASKPDPLPDVIVEVIRTSVVADGGEVFPFWQLQQRHVEVFEVSLAFMVDNQDPEAAATQLRNFRDRLRDAVLPDETLSGAVGFRSPFVSFDFTPPFVEYEDGTKGREMTMTLTVGDLVEVP
jgi:hypothetical protein